MRGSRRQWLRTAAALSGALVSPGWTQGRSQAETRGECVFGLIGDLPYSDAAEAHLASLLAAIDRDPIDFVLHVGDLKGSREPCDDARYDRRIGLLAASAHPLLVLPGDNDWTDCSRADPKVDPLERLAALRTRIGTGRQPLGRASASARQRLALEQGVSQPENLRWKSGGVHFVAAHVVGSGNAQRGFAGAAEAFEARMADNLAWVRGALEQAQREQALALVIAFHAEPDWTPSPRSPFFGWISLLREVAESWSRPLLLLHGDSHRFRADRPLRSAAGQPYPHVMRVESFGWPHTSQWVRIAWRQTPEPGFDVSIRSGQPEPAA